MMDMKLWCILFLIGAGSAPGVVSGCSSSNLGSNSDPRIGSVTLSPAPGMPSYWMTLPIHNGKPTSFKAKIKVVGGQDEVEHYVGIINVSGAGGYDVMFGQIKQKRKKPVYIRIDWSRGKEQGVKRFIISAKQTDSTPVS